MNFRLSIGQRLFGLAMLGLSLQATTASAAVGLQMLYEQAIKADPQYLAALEDRKAAQTLIWQAGGQLLPQVSASGARTRNETDSRQRYAQLGLADRLTHYEFVSKNASLNLNWALFRPQSWAALAQAAAQIRVAEGNLRQAELDLVLRVAQGYFDVLLAEDTVRLYAEQKSAIAEGLKQAKRYFEAGVGTVTDINEAQARFDVVTAQEIAANNNLEVKRRALEAVVGSYQDKIQSLGDKLALEQPVPSAFESWQEFALANNPQLKAREAALEVSQQEVYKSAAAHLPTVDLVAARSRQDNPGYTMIDIQNWNSYVGVQVNVPLFSGGSTQARVMQSQYNRERAKYELEGAERSTMLAVRQFFLSVVSGVSQVEAYKQAVKSNELALYSAQKGQEAGVRTSFDVLNAQSLLYSAKRDLAEARYSYVMSRLKLRAAAGLLGGEDIALIQSWLLDERERMPVVTESIVRSGKSLVKK